MNRRSRLAVSLALLVTATVPTRAEPGQATHAQGPSLTLLTDDYPRDARAKGETGRALVRFLVNERGRVHECSVLESSGSAALDATTCNIARRGRFKPARDANGAPRSEYWLWGIDWQLPSSKPSIRADVPAPESEHAVANAADPPTDDEIGVVVGTAKWETMPHFTMKRISGDFGAGAGPTFRGIIDRKACSFPGVTARRYDVSIRYALRLSPDGRIERAMIEDLGCRPLEHLIASMILQKEFRQAIEPPGGTDARWHKSMVRFSGPRL